MHQIAWIDGSSGGGLNLLCFDKIFGVWRTQKPVIKGDLSGKLYNRNDYCLEQNNQDFLKKFGII